MQWEEWKEEEGEDGRFGCNQIKGGGGVGV